MIWTLISDRAPPEHDATTTASAAAPQSRSCRPRGTSFSSVLVTLTFIAPIVGGGRSGSGTSRATSSRSGSRRDDATLHGGDRLVAGHGGRAGGDIVADHESRR